MADVHRHIRGPDKLSKPHAIPQERAAEGRARPTDPQLLDDLAHDMVASALCDHERLATLPLTSAMRYFSSELEDHVLRSSCPAGVCRPDAVTAGASPARHR